MLKTLKNIAKIGNSTIKYPFAPINQPDSYRGKPEHSLEQCIACGACAVTCPPDAIQMHASEKDGTTTWSINYGRCIFCGRCEEACPIGALVLGKEFELAVMRKEDLYETCEYKLQECLTCGRPFAPKKEVEYAAKLLCCQSDKIDPKDALHLVKTCPACKREADAKRLDRVI